MTQNEVVDLNVHALKERIENMSKYHQVEVLRILTQLPNVICNENKNGTFVNLTGQPNKVIDALDCYVRYVDEQQKQLITIENEKSFIEQQFFSTTGKVNKTT